MNISGARLTASLGIAALVGFVASDIRKPSEVHVTAVVPESSLDLLLQQHMPLYIDRELHTVINEFRNSGSDYQEIQYNDHTYALAIIDENIAFIAKDNDRYVDVFQLYRSVSQTQVYLLNPLSSPIELSTTESGFSTGSLSIPDIRPFKDRLEESEIGPVPSFRYEFEVPEKPEEPFHDRNYYII